MFEGPGLFCLLSGSTFLSLDLIFCLVNSFVLFIVGVELCFSLLSRD